VGRLVATELIAAKISSIFDALRGGRHNELVPRQRDERRVGSGGRNGLDLLVNGSSYICPARGRAAARHSLLRRLIVNNNLSALSVLPRKNSQMRYHHRQFNTHECSMNKNKTHTQ